MMVNLLLVSAFVDVGDSETVSGELRVGIMGRWGDGAREVPFVSLVMMAGNSLRVLFWVGCLLSHI